MSQEGVKQPEYGTELKLAAVRRVLAGESVSAVAQELGVRRKRLYVWKNRYEELGEAGLMHRRGGRPRKQAAAVNGSEAKAGRESCRWRGSVWRNWNVESVSRNWSWIFSAKPWGAQKRAGSDLHVDRGAGRARRPQRGEPRGILPALGSVGAAAGGHGHA